MFKVLTSNDGYEWYDNEHDDEWFATLEQAEEAASKIINWPYVSVAKVVKEPG